MKKLTILFFIVASAGCMSLRLPPVSAEEFHYRRTDPMGGTEVNAKNVNATETEITADEVTWNTTYPQFSVVVSTKKFRQPLKANP